MFKIGDSVRVKNNAHEINSNICFVYENMKIYLGKEFIIRDCYFDQDGNYYTLEGAFDSEGLKYQWKFSESWLEYIDEAKFEIEDKDIEEILCLK